MKLTLTILLQLERGYTRCLSLFISHFPLRVSRVRDPVLRLLPKMQQKLRLQAFVPEWIFSWTYLADSFTLIRSTHLQDLMKSIEEKWQLVMVLYFVSDTLKILTTDMFGQNWQNGCLQSVTVEAFLCNVCYGCIFQENSCTLLLSFFLIMCYLPAVMCKCQVRSRLFGLEWKRICNLCTPACKWYQKFIGRAEAEFFFKLSANAVKLTIPWCMLQSAEHCLSLVYLCDSHWSKVCVSFELRPSGTYAKPCSPLCEVHCMFFLVFILFKSGKKWSHLLIFPAMV